MSNPIVTLSELFTKFPGIGPRQARRFVYYLLHHDQKTAQDLIQAIQALKATTKQCAACFRFFTATPRHDSPVCDICTQASDHSRLMIVEKDADLENIKKSGTYDGLYFVLGGLLSILEKEPEKRIRINQLSKRITSLYQGGELEEIILALSASVEGDNTAEYVVRAIQKIPTQKPITISTLGRGLSTGTELEYSDPDTIREAFKSRR